MRVVTQTKIVSVILPVVLALVACSGSAPSGIATTSDASVGGATGIGGASSFGGSLNCPESTAPEKGFIPCGSGPCAPQCDLSKEVCCSPTDGRAPYCAANCGCDPNEGSGWCMNEYECDGPEDCDSVNPYCCGGIPPQEEYLATRHTTTQCSYYENCQGEYSLYLPLVVCHTSDDCGGQLCRQGNEVPYKTCGPM